MRQVFLFFQQIGFLFFLFSIGLPGQGYSQNTFSSGTGARGNGMANSVLTYETVHAVFNNPAGISQVEQLAALAFSENRFLLAELSTHALGVVLPVSSGSFGLTLQQYGFEDYREQKAGLKYGRTLTSNLSLGLGVNLLRWQITEYGSINTLAAEVGLQYQLLPQITTATRLFIPVDRNDWEEELPVNLQMGVSYKPSESLLIGAVLEKNEQEDYQFRVGLEYLVQQKIGLRAGFEPQTEQLSIGTGFSFASFSINLAGKYHSVLGWSPSIGILWQQPSKTPEF